MSECHKAPQMIQRNLVSTSKAPQLGCELQRHPPSLKAGILAALSARKTFIT